MKSESISSQHSLTRNVTILGLSLCIGATSAFAVLVPQPVPSSEFSRLPLAEFVTGFVEAGGYSGSGAVTGHGKVLLTCAHLPFKAGAWLPPNSVTFAAHHSAWTRPASTIPLRAYHKFANYADAVRRYGNNSKYAYQWDTVVGLAYANLANGYSARYWNAASAGAVLKNRSYAKKTVGYPNAGSVRTNWFMYRMTFTGSFSQIYGSYYGISGATTYGGNSGGPIFCYGNGQWGVAGVVVSADFTNSFQVRAIDSYVSQMLVTAAQQAGR